MYRLNGNQEKKITQENIISYPSAWYKFKFLKIAIAKKYVEYQDLLLLGSVTITEV